MFAFAVIDLLAQSRWWEQNARTFKGKSLNASGVIQSYRFRESCIIDGRERKGVFQAILNM